MAPDKQYHFLILIFKRLIVGSSERAFLRYKEAFPTNGSKQHVSFSISVTVKPNTCNNQELVHNDIQFLRKYRVIRNDYRGFNNLSYTIHLRYEYAVAPKDLEVYVPPLPASFPELKVRIRTAIETITADMLQTVWNELDYRVDVCKITKGAHSEHL